MEQINMRKDTIRKSSAVLLTVLLAGCLMACGKKTTNTDAGMEAIGAQNYEHDRRNTFDPIIVPKHSRSFGKMDEQIDRKSVV